MRRWKGRRGGGFGVRLMGRETKGEGGGGISYHDWVENGNYPCVCASVRFTSDLIHNDKGIDWTGMDIRGCWETNE